MNSETNMSYVFRAVMSVKMHFSYYKNACSEFHSVKSVKLNLNQPEICF